MIDQFDRPWSRVALCSIARGVNQPLRLRILDHEVDGDRVLVSPETVFSRIQFLYTHHAVLLPRSNAHIYQSSSSISIDHGGSSGRLQFPPPGKWFPGWPPLASSNLTLSPKLLPQGSIKRADIT